MNYVLILGANSDVGKSVAIEYAKNGYDLYLAARKIDGLQGFARDITVKYQKDVKCVELDILDYPSPTEFHKKFIDEFSGVISMIGYLGDQVKAQNSFVESQLIMNTNFLGIMNILEIIANDFEKRKTGFIVGISSVAGDRGRKTNYHYGAAKAAFSTYLAGLRNRLFASNVHVMTVKPGFINTKMTKEMNLPKNLTAQPDEVAKDIFNAQQNKKHIIYTKKRWWLIMLIIKYIPETIFKRLNL